MADKYLNELNVRETDAMDRDGWRATIKSSNPVTWKEDIDGKSKVVSHPRDTFL